MPVLRFGESRLVGDCQPVLVIAEIGQNHQGLFSEMMIVQ